MTKEGSIYGGINNIYTVRTEEGSTLQCRIKGKILKEKESFHNPLAPGDRVLVEEGDRSEGLILSRLPRRNCFSRWNQKRDTWQVIASNLDLLLVVMSVGGPPFRPRFVDRVLINARQGEVEAAVLINKIDQGIEEAQEQRLRAWEALDIPVLRVSAESGAGMEDLQLWLRGKVTAFFGPSGVGKSTLLNLLAPGNQLAVGAISSKYSRGRHVTNSGKMMDAPGGGVFIDTPGIRSLLIRGIEPQELPQWFPEFAPLSPQCSFQPCSHRQEPDCAVRRARETGRIHPDRYTSYLRIREELEEQPGW